MATDKSDKNKNVLPRDGSGDYPPVMRKDGQWDSITEIASGPDASGVVVVSLAAGKRKARVTQNENGVWQESWA